ncbi:DNA-binding transcriptional LysR family regulator [Acinetobacter calcoaceticus]|uniref:DNA-binding transcriptional LysR family regulator n=1 Tax=Acinetobacter calcoaceticus TaxID=471 RepID=A0A4R1XLN9_ACICA|nr:DNA-binding transcriptional LysR family regulator [Acinetobacter calcoaceticus]
MELRDLTCFVAVVEEQSFTKAAERLFIAQPPLSRKIQKLEQELGTQLFERGSRPLQTTSAGHFFYQHATKLLANAEEVKSMTKRVGSAERVIRMGFVASLLYGLLPRIIYSYRQQQPQLKVEVVEMSTKDQIQALKEGKIDVGFGRLRISDPAVRRVLLREERLTVAMHSSHPFSQYKQGIFLADIVDEHQFFYPTTPKPNYTTQIQALFSEHGLTTKRGQEARDIQLALGLVAAGEGICIVPEGANAIQLPYVNYVPLMDADAVSPIYLAMRGMDASDDILALFHCIFQVFDQEGIKYDKELSQQFI